MDFNLYFIRDHGIDLIQAGLFTLALCAVSVLIGIIGGAILCAMRLSDSRFASRAARLLIGTVRSLPELLLIFWLYSCLPLILGITLDALQTGLLILGLISSCALAEVIRGGLASVSTGQREAARALGLSGPLTMVLVVAPQAMRIMVAPFLNFLCDLLKASTLLSALGIAELAYEASVLGSETYRYLEIYSLIGVFYFVIIFSLSRLAKSFESRMTPR